MSKIALSGNPLGSGTFTIASPNSNTDRVLNLPDVAGTVAVASSGTPSSSTFLRGDNVWAAIPSSAPTTDQVLTATAGASVGAVGTYAYAGNPVAAININIAPGDTLAGSSLQYRSSGDNSFGQNYTGTLSGTWRCMGFYRNTNTSFAAPLFSLWLRIS